MGWLDQQMKMFIKFTPQAEWLRSRNFPQVGQHLDFVLRDLRVAKGSATQMYRRELEDLREEERREHKRQEEERLEQLRKEERREQKQREREYLEWLREEERLEQEKREEEKIEDLREERIEQEGYEE